MKINNNWDIVLKEYDQKLFDDLMKFVDDEYASKVIFPSYDNIFASLKLTDYNEVKVVILGQDPYHGENEAHGLSFSVKEGVKMPPSLKNILKELDNDLKIKKISSDLTNWAKQGVLLLNSIMTVERDKPLSHKEKGWEDFTDFIIKKLNDSDNSIVFVLWGSYAKSKKRIITNKKHMIIENVHPSPLSAYRGFFGSSPFSKINEFLENNGYSAIKWER